MNSLNIDSDIIDSVETWDESPLGLDYYMILTKLGSIYKCDITGLNLVKINHIFKETGLKKLKKNQHDVNKLFNYHR